MPHSISPESTPAEEMSQPASQADNVKPEAESQEDVAMDDAPTAAAAETAKVKLEEMFDDADSDSDSEFASSAPAPTSQEDASQPAPMYAPASQGPY